MPTETDLERRIRDAFEYQAGKAPHPAAVRVPEQRRAPRRTMALVVAAAAIVVLAGIAVPVLTHVLAKPATPAVSAATTPKVSIQSSQQPAPETMWYRVGWLPDGYVEENRTVSPNRVDRLWAPKGSGGPVSVILTSINLADSNADTRKTYQNWLAQTEGRTMVNGKPAVFIAFHNSPTDAWARLVWLASPDVVLDLNVQIPGTDSPIAQRIADSITADAVAPHPVDPFTVGYVPGGKTLENYTVSGFSATYWWVEEEFGTAGDTNGEHSLAVSWEPKRPTLPPYTVGMPLDGQWLQVSLTGASQAELNQILHSITLNTDFDRSWIGTS